MEKTQRQQNSNNAVSKLENSLSLDATIRAIRELELASHFSGVCAAGITSFDSGIHFENAGILLEAWRDGGIRLRKPHAADSSVSCELRAERL